MGRPYAYARDCGDVRRSRLRLSLAMNMQEVVEEARDSRTQKGASVCPKEIRDHIDEVRFRLTQLENAYSTI